MVKALELEKVAELVERFYDKLIKDSYYSSMFAERGVDIELLKSRQRAFISRLVSEKSADNQVAQVYERHPFQTTPERAKIWMDTMVETIEEMNIDPEIKETLVEKISFLVEKLVNK